MHLLKIARGATIAALLGAPILVTSTAQGGNPRLSGGPPKVISEARHDVSRPLRSIPPAAPVVRTGDEVENEIPRRVRTPGGPDGALQTPLTTPAPGMPSPLTSFPGAQNTNNASLVFPPDPNGDVGPNNYIQVVNLTFTIFSKTGTKLLGPSPINTIWSGFGGLCQTNNDGDPIVLYDRMADRWLISQFAISSTSSHQCIAISQTNDPTGAWFRYDFPYSNTVLNDYPKFGIWPDAYYMSANQFTLSTSTFSGTGVVAYERARMLQGLTARAIYINLGASSSTSGFSSWLPADLDGSMPPPAGAPNHYLTIQGTSLGDPADRLQQWDFHVDWTTPANSTFTQAAVLPVAAFNGNMCNFQRACIAQLGTTAKLDAISDRLMFRNAYRNFGSYEAEVVNHTVNVGSNQAGIRWYEVRNTSTSPTLFQQGTYAGDSANTQSRWMGSAALDANGDIAVGYSDSSSAVHPSIRYVGRLVGDPLGTLPQGETTLIAGAGSQTVPNSRWGDYSMLSVDPSDDCTFWYTQEYYAATGTNWQTRVGSFKFPSCGPSTAPVNTSAPTISGSAVQGQTLTASPGVWSGSPPPTFAFQWQRCDSGGANCVNVVGATGSTYLLGAGDVGSTIVVVVTATNSVSSASAPSAATAVVAASSGIGPTTPVLDNFNRANGGVGANWSLIRPSGFAGMNVLSNAAVDASATLFSWDFWNAASFGPDAEAYVTVAHYGASDTIRIGVRVSNGGTTSQSGYYVAISSAGAWSIIRIDSGISTTLASGATQALASGDKVAIRIVGTVVSALHFTGGSWQQVLSYDTSADGTRYSNAGNLAVEFRTSTLDDFGGGTI
jgi:hypothetical protein